MVSQQSEKSRSWWKLVLAGLLAFAFGIAAVGLPAGIMFQRFLDVISGHANPLSGGMTAVAALLALAALVAVDGLLHLFGAGVIGKWSAGLRGVAGIAFVAAIVFWPAITVVVAVEVIGAWTIFVGVLELIAATKSGEEGKDRAVLIIAAIASMVIGVAMMKWVYAGAVAASAVIGVAAAARGISLILSGIRQRSKQFDGSQKQAIKREAA
jgi:uncharacterized membrane protein HdeD (DUF308 family)